MPGVWRALLSSLPVLGPLGGLLPLPGLRLLHLPVHRAHGEGPHSRELLPTKSLCGCSRLGTISRLVLQQWVQVGVNLSWPLRPKTWSRSWWQVMGCVGVPLYKIYPRKTQWRTEKPERTEEDAALISRTDSVDDMIAQVLSKKWVWVLRSWFEWPV